MDRTLPPRRAAFAVWLGLVLASPAAAVVDVSGPAQGIGVAPFSSASAETDVAFSDSSAVAPDVATALARALGSGTDLRVVTPSDLLRDDRGLRDPQAADVRRWADWNRVENVIVGRTNGAATVVELRSGHSGGAFAEYRLEPATPEDVPGAVRRLAFLILADLGEESSHLDEALPPVSAPPVAAAAPEAPVVETQGADDTSSGPIGLLPGPRRDDPISINSEELEVLPEAGGRRLVFSNNVEVMQGDVTLHADRLEAIYPQGASQPDQLVATGHVRVNQGDRRARCEEATYERVANTIVCRGKAEVTQGCDRVRGQEIEFDLVRERVRVSGAASVVIQSDDQDGGACADGATPAPGATP